MGGPVINMIFESGDRILLPVAVARDVKMLMRAVAGM
ncbi:hypothetical protein Rhal01_00491 [Rubritalea halochordaticola]|uniref:Uncharacterized protein n=1 Tax=Rubritalea halochordaticola TaxID=714537 RepID=A0ABP9UZR4_9BACT